MSHPVTHILSLALATEICQDKSFLLLRATIRGHRLLCWDWEKDNLVGVTLEGSSYGMEWFIYPDFSKLQGANVWADAASQIFYSLGIACGSLVTLASYSNFSNNCHRCDYTKTERAHLERRRKERETRSFANIGHLNSKTDRKRQLLKSKMSGFTSAP